MTKDELAALTPEQKRIKIAEILGWKDIKQGRLMNEFYGRMNGWDYKAIVPDYLNDLNACHEMEKVVIKSSKPWSSGPTEPDWYLDNLRKVTGGKLMNHEGLTTLSHGSFLLIVHATAAQRCDAFLLVLG